MSREVDAEYARLRAAGAAGWGNAAAARRRDGWMRTLAWLRRHADFPHPPARLLELGCGNGLVSALFAAQGYRVAGIERSGEAVAWARALFEAHGLRGTFRQGDVRAMPACADNAFDVAIDGNCLHCLIGRDRAACLAEVRRVVRAGGVFVVSTMCGEPKSAAARARFDPAARCLMEDGKPARALLEAAAIVAEVEAAGFRAVAQQVRANSWWDHLTLLAAVR
jgi:SAM-dependent methyltransferase